MNARSTALLLTAILAGTTTLDCQPEAPPPTPLPPWQQREVAIEITGRSKIPVTIYTPNEVELRGEVLVLPGWKHERSRWVKQTKLLDHARAHGFRLILPEMGVSIYASEYFEETKRKWAPVPGLVFITDYLIPQLQKQGYLTGFNEAISPLAPPATDKQPLPRLLMGLSTGGRGVLQIGLARPDLWEAAAAFSGDYDQTRTPKDRLMTAVYGPFEDFEDRWSRVDNPIYAIDNWKIPLYIAHGTKDTVVRVGESRVLYDTLRATHPNLKVEIETPAMGHDYPFWGDYSLKAFQFFDRILGPGQKPTDSKPNSQGGTN